MRTRDLPFDQMLDEVSPGRAEAGLLIHEGQLTFAEHGLHRLLDLGVWWREQTGLPLPLGARRRAPRHRRGSMTSRPSSARRSKQDSQTARRRWRTPIGFGRGIDAATADEFVAMYVNDLTLDMGALGREALERLLGFAPELV